jgi:hypothetical protein
MWWPERKSNETTERLEALLNKRTAVVLTWLDGSAKDAALRALDDIILDARREARSERSPAPPDTAA